MVNTEDDKDLQAEDPNGMLHVVDTGARSKLTDDVLISCIMLQKSIWLKGMRRNSFEIPYG